MMNKKLATIPPNNLPDFDLTKVFEYLIASVSFIYGWGKVIDAYFKSKKESKQQFIEDVVKSTIASVLGDFKSEFNEFKKTTESKIDQFNSTVRDIYKEVRK